MTNNGGVAAAGGTILSTRLPAGLTQPVASGTGWTCQVQAPLVTCTRASTLAAGARSTLTLSSRVAAAAGTLLTTGWSLTPTDAAPADNTATDQVIVVR